MFLDHSRANPSSVAFTPLQRYCYICGRHTLFSVIVEPLMLPVCSQFDCKRRAETIPSEHCRVRLDNGHVCGRPLARMSANGHSTCARHALQQLRTSALPESSDPLTDSLEDMA